MLLEKKLFLSCKPQLRLQLHLNNFQTDNLMHQLSWKGTKPSPWRLKLPPGLWIGCNRASKPQQHHHQDQLWHSPQWSRSWFTLMALSSQTPLNLKHRNELWQSDLPLNFKTGCNIWTQCLELKCTLSCNKFSSITVSYAVGLPFPVYSVKQWTLPI